MLQDIVDAMPFTYQITESEGGRMRVEGVFQRSDVPNANKRVYPRSLWEKELKEKRVMEAMDNRAMFGELDHPSDGKTSLKRVSHIITGLHLESDGTVTGAAEILPTPSGDILKILFESGAQVGISSRGSGSVNNGVVAEDYKLSTFDFVARPSTPGALPTPGGKRSSRYEDDGHQDTMTDITPQSEMHDPNYFGEATTNDMFDDIDFSTLLNEEETASVYERVTSLCNAVAGGIREEYHPEVQREIFLFEHELLSHTVDNPEHRVIASSLLDRLEEAKNTLAYGTNDDEDNLHEEVNMNRLQFIQNRLEEAEFGAEQEAETQAYELAEELSELSDEELISIAEEVGVLPSEEDELAEALDNMSDAELVELAVDQGVLDESVLYEDEEEEEVMDLYDSDEYTQELEANLEEASTMIEELAAALEETSDDTDGLSQKYETALGIIQETVSRFQMLQEAIGGEERADAILESYISNLETEMANYDEDGTDLTEDTNIEYMLHEDGGSSTGMSRYVQLAEEAVTKLNLN